MRIHFSPGLAIFLVACAVGVSQETVPDFTGVWTLDLKLSKIEATHRPISSTTSIRYDGRVWDFSRTHHFPKGRVDTWTTKLIVDSKEDHIERDAPLTSRSRMTREGDVLVLTESYLADTGEKATNTVRYSLSNDAQTLTEDEREVTSEGNEHNVWVLKRESNGG